MDSQTYRQCGPWTYGISIRLSTIDDLGKSKNFPFGVIAKTCFIFFTLYSGFPPVLQLYINGKICHKADLITQERIVDFKLPGK
jgi:hypothetical protein